ncbi:hypothetical protein [Falsiroseomonas sp. CW058]|uniref:hypothetical protein n=1 Tax=Falsiroseomonas sp. CW058 TaxID=3388664 RepID=UPI003D3101D1
MRFDMNEMGGGEVLAGAVNGRHTLGRMLAAAAAEPDQPAPVFLDFAGVEVATASFLRESVLAFRDAVRGRRSRLYPVIANPNDAVRDDLAELVGPRGDVLMACVLDPAGSVTQAAPIGELDPKQRLTFDLVRKHGETDAAALMRAYGEEEGTKHATAWNNRLSALAALGLVVEVSQGRAKRYRPLFEGA